MTSFSRHGDLSRFMLSEWGMAARQKHRRLLGEAVRAYRKKTGFSQEKTAEKAGLSTVFISRVERGIESPSVDSLVKIAKALGVRVRDLVADL